MSLIDDPVGNEKENLAKPKLSVVMIVDINLLPIVRVKLDEFAVNPYTSALIIVWVNSVVTSLVVLYILVSNFIGPNFNIPIVDIPVDINESLVSCDISGVLV